MYVFSGGLSPLARGTPVYGIGPVFDARFIPAGAGNTHLKLSAPSLISVYPRWRGEHPAGIDLIRKVLGLSPLARGTLY